MVLPKSRKRNALDRNRTVPVIERSVRGPFLLREIPLIPSLDFLINIDQKTLHAFGHDSPKSLIARRLAGQIRLYNIAGWVIIFIDNGDFWEIASYMSGGSIWKFREITLTVAREAFTTKNNVLLRIRSDLKIMHHLYRRMGWGIGEARIIGGIPHVLYYFDKACCDYWLAGGSW